MSDGKPARKVILVSLHGHEWPVYPCNVRGKISYKVPHRVAGVRKFKSFADLAKAKKDAKSVLYETFGGVRTQVHMTEDERFDWKAAVDLLRAAGIRSTLESVARHYADLAGIVGGEALLTDVARQYAKRQGKTCKPV